MKAILREAVCIYESLCASLCAYVCVSLLKRAYENLPLLCDTFPYTLCDPRGSNVAHNFRDSSHFACGGVDESV
jgi:hypothetical protein